MIRFLIVAASVCVVCGESTHHFRHLGAVTEALRERLAMGEQVDGTPDEKMLPELTKVLSRLHERQRQQMHRFISRSGNQQQKEGTSDVSENQADAYKRVITRALSHVLNNLQTVEGGQEAARWIKSLKGTSSNHEHRHHAHEKHTGGEIS